MSLSGRRVLVTRSRDQYEGLAQRLCTAGAEPLPFPCIAHAPSRNLSELNECVRDAAAGRFDWIVLTSVRTVEVVAQQLAESALALPTWLRCAVIGPATRSAAQTRLGLSSVMPSDLDEVTGSSGFPFAPGDRILLPQSSRADSRLPALLRSAGAEVRTVVAYLTVTGTGGVELSSELSGKGLDAVTFTSGSCVEGFHERLAREAPHAHLPRSVVLAPMGKSSADAAAALFAAHPVIQLRDQSLDGLVAGLTQFFQENHVRSLS